MANGTSNVTDSVGEPAKEAKFKFLLFREDCFDHFLNFNFGHEDCLAITISKVLGYLIILGAAGVKLPQIIGLLKSQSGEGVLASMYYAENILLMTNGCYAIHLGSPFSVYGENFLILAQNVIIIGLLWKFQKDISITTKLLVLLVEGSLFTFLFTDIIVPEQFWGYLMNAQLIILAYSRIPQILLNFKEGSTGQLAFITFFLNTAGNTARLFTMFKEANDKLLMLNVMVSFVLNFTITAQIIILGGGKKKVEDEKKNVTKTDKPSSKGTKRKID